MKHFTVTFGNYPAEDGSPLVNFMFDGEGEVEAQDIKEALEKALVEVAKIPGARLWAIYEAEHCPSED